MFKIIKVVRGKMVARDGIEGTGKRLLYTCGFCKDDEGAPTRAFRSRHERNRHANVCPR